MTNQTKPTIDINEAYRIASVAVENGMGTDVARTVVLLYEENEGLKAALAEKKANTLLLDEVPEGWRLNSVDASIEGRFAISLRRCGNNEGWWHSLTEEEKDCIHLYATGIGISFSEALRAAIKAALVVLNEKTL